MRPNITELIVEKDKCIGCGVCDTICPVNVLKMDFNSIGNYQPFESEGCLDKCTLCLDVCPFIEDNDDEYEIARKLYSNIDNIKYDDSLGYFINTYEIHKQNDSERLASASGGAGNWFQKLLFESNQVDYILTVEANDDSDKLFKFSVFNNSNELDKSRGSVYYPTEISEVLDYVMMNNGSYAITALPCYAKAIRLAQSKNHKLKKRIKYIIGLVCGQMKSKYFTEELGEIALGKGELLSVKYRVKQPEKPSSDYAFNFTNIDNKTKSLTWSSSPSKFWTSRMFTPNACNFCTDVFALNADIVLMDAWLPEYTKDYKGHTLVIVRTPEIDDLLKDGKNASIKEFDYSDVYKSQKNVVLNKNNYVFGNKNYLINKIVNYRKEIQYLSNHNYTKNKREIDLIFKKIRIMQQLVNIKTLPIRVIKKIYRMIKGSR